MSIFFFRSPKYRYSLHYNLILNESRVGFCWNRSFIFQKLIKVLTHSVWMYKYKIRFSSIFPSVHQIFTFFSAGYVLLIWSVLGSAQTPISNFSRDKIPHTGGGGDVWVRRKCEHLSTKHFKMFCRSSDKKWNFFISFGFFFNFQNFILHHSGGAREFGLGS